MDAILNAPGVLLTAQLKEYSRSLGFDAIGIAKAEPLDTEQEHYDTWLERGYNGTMQYMERTRSKRLDPRLVLPSVQSIIVTALSYDTPARHSGATGKLSRYSWGMITITSFFLSSIVSLRGYRNAFLVQKARPTSTPDQ